MTDSVVKLVNDLITYLFLGYIVYRIFNYAELRIQVLYARAWKVRLNKRQVKQETQDEATV
jgi:hypothetical protein